MWVCEDGYTYFELDIDLRALRRWVVAVIQHEIVLH